MALAGDLDAEEVRVLGCLVEKQLATPEHYPLTANALASACNQSSNRNPVAAYDEATVLGAVARLRERRLVRVVYSQGNRAPKYRHALDEALGLGPPELAVLCELLVRGPQTPGELRARAGRLYPFASLAEVEAAVDALAARRGGEDAVGAVVERLPQRPGQREGRVRHRLGPPSEAQRSAAEASPGADEEPASRAAAEGPVDDGRLGALEEEVRRLRDELAVLRARVEGLLEELG